MKLVYLLTALFFVIASPAATASLKEAIEAIYGDKSNYKFAYKLLHDEVNNGNGKAYYYLYVLYDYGAGVKRDASKAKEYLHMSLPFMKDSALDGNIKDGRLVYYRIREPYFSAEEATQWRKDYLRMLENKAAKNDPMAIEEMAIRTGTGIKNHTDDTFILQPDLEVSFQLLIKAAELGRTRAAMDIATSYQLGRYFDLNKRSKIYIPIDTKKAVYWYKQTLKDNNDSHRKLGNIFYYGAEDFSKDFSKAKEHYLLVEKDNHDHHTLKNLESIECMKDASTVLFNAKLKCVDRQSLQQNIKEIGAIAEREIYRYFSDIYDSSKILSGTTKLVVSYLKHDFANATYFYPSSGNLDQVIEIKDLIESKYGEPRYQSGNISVGTVVYKWELNDGLEIEIKREWPKTNITLVYRDPIVNIAMNDEITRLKKTQNLKEYRKQTNAY